MRGKLFLRIEDAPLYRSDWNRFLGRNLVILPLFDKAQRHRVPFARIEKTHPGHEFKRGRGGFRIYRGEAFQCIRDIDSVDLTRAPGVMLE